MARIVTPEADAMIDKPFHVLDHGEVTMVDYMGGDARIVEAARTSYQGGTKTLREDRGLIRYLMRNLHMTPFEMVTLLFFLQMPLFVANQLVRHRTAKLNSESARYSILRDLFYFPTQWRGQDVVNKQASSGLIAKAYQTMCDAAFRAHCKAAYALYEQMMEWGVAREMARMCLPQNIYVRWFWKCDLRNLFNVIYLRDDAHAQPEIQVFAAPMKECVKAVAPMAFEAFEDFQQRAVRLSKQEHATVVHILKLAQERVVEDAEAKSYFVDQLGEKEGTALYNKMGLAA